MPKCEYHQDYIDLNKNLKEHIDRVETGLKEHIYDVDKKAERSLIKINTLETTMHETQKEHKETEIYVKELYKKMDALTTQVSNLVIKFDTYFIEQMSIKHETDKNSDFTTNSKKLIFEVIKWAVLLVLGAAIARA